MFSLHGTASGDWVCYNQTEVSTSSRCCISGRMETTQPTSQEGGPTADPAVEASPWQLLLLLFDEIWSILCSVAPGFRTEEWMQNWKDGGSASWLENGILCYLQQNSASRHWAGKGERTMGRDRSWRFIQETDSMFVSPSCLASWILLAFHMRPRDTVHVFYIFVTFRNRSRGSAWFGVNTVFLHPLPLLPKQRGGVWSALCWPSEELQQTHLIQAEITGRPQRACVD